MQLPKGSTVILIILIINLILSLFDLFSNGIFKECIFNENVCVMEFSIPLKSSSLFTWAGLFVIIGNFLAFLIQAIYIYKKDKERKFKDKLVNILMEISTFQYIHFNPNNLSFMSEDQQIIRNQIISNFDGKQKNIFQKINYFLPVDVGDD